MTELFDQADERPAGVEYEPFPEPRRRRGWLRWFAAAGALALVLAVAAGVWVARQVDPPGGPGAPVALEIPTGSSTKRIAAILDAHGVIASARVFELYVKVNGGGPWQAGRYEFRANSSVGDAIRVLDAGPKLSFIRLTIPEGFTLEQVAQRVGRLPGRSAQRFLELAASGTIRSDYQPAGSNNLEGLLLPDTYNVDDKDDEAAILRRMVEAFDEAVVELGIPEQASTLGVTPYQVAIIASMIEREARVADERPKVARVIYNRLDRGMRLGIDATIRYELKKPSGPLLRSELARDTPYNTRTRAGLPPTPIAMPGRASLEAAANPEPGPWLYYVVADENGRHAFATTNEEFIRAKNAARAKGLL